jgi:hypothetical protein
MKPKPIDPIIHLPLTFHWYDETEAGRKGTEYRAMTDKWRKEIWEKRHELTTVVFRRGFTKRTLTRKITLIDIGPCPIPGWSGDYYRIHFTP